MRLSPGPPAEEVGLARSAAPAEISDEGTVWVLAVARGTPFPEAWSGIKERLESGAIALPEPGRAVAYMMSRHTELHDPRMGHSQRYPPHFMVVAPYRTNADGAASQA